MKTKNLLILSLISLLLSPILTGLATPAPVFTDKPDYSENEVLHLTVMGGTSNGVILIQFENENDIEWVIQGYYNEFGQYDEFITLPGHWSPGEYTILVKDQDSNIVHQTTLMLDVGTGPVDWDHQLEPGWNFISFPITPDDNSVASVFSELGFYQVFAFDGVGYYTPTTVEPGSEYWVLVDHPQPLMVHGVPVQSLSITLDFGWNGAGGPYQTVDANSVFPAFYQLLSWNHGMYYVNYQFKPGNGYWALVLDETTIDIPPI